MDNSFSVHLLCWHDGEPLLLAVRDAIRMRDQCISATPISDGLDKVSRHALALNATGGAIGCGRITAPLAQAAPCIGGIAVLPQWRSKKVGTALLELLLDHARSQHYPEVVLHAQARALPVYRRHFGFDEADAEEYTDAAIGYVKVRLRL